MFCMFMFGLFIIVWLLCKTLEWQLPESTGNFWRLGAEFKSKWPAIDDDEFMRRCKPGTKRETALRVRQIVAQQVGVPVEHIYPEQCLVIDLGFE